MATPEPLTMDEKIAKAEARTAKMQAYGEQLRRIATAESEVPGAFRTGEVTKSQLAEKYGISTMTVSRILADHGIEGATVKRLTDAERAEVVDLLKEGTSLEDVAEAYGVSKNSIRTVGLKSGILKPGERKPHRSDEEYALIEAFDTEARQRFNGAGLYNLGTGLRSWQDRKRKEAAALANGGTAPAEPTSAPEQEAVAHGDVVPEATHTADDPMPAGTPENAGEQPEGDFKF